MDKLTKLSLGDWKEKLKKLESEELPKARQRLNDAAPTGDWEENAEYEDAQNQVELLESRIAEIRQMIKKMEKGEKGNSNKR
ncbi:hypothetical protein M1563_03585 [Patescibacteria group bacterium]|nr:hypothetical protein [Patescibacteria group bacterium]MCL5410015.1 hypothetical protein [Patescibacteria group bacterium]